MPSAIPPKHCDHRAPDILACRLCAGEARFSFARMADDGDDIRCYRCANCESLQTDVPYWIDALYSNSSGASNLGLDTMAVERCVMARVAVAFLWKLGGFKNPDDRLLDWGGGPGLFTRLMRDIGVNAFLYDKYALNHYAIGFTRTDGQHYDFITAFEVFEHFANPATDLQPLFAMDARFLLISTCIYRGQGAEWAYLGPPKSEHVFFYSRKAIRLIAGGYGYEVFELPGEMTLFYKPPVSQLRLRLARLLLSNQHVAHLVFAFKRKWSLAGDDFSTMQRRIDKTSTE